MIKDVVNRVAINKSIVLVYLVDVFHKMKVENYVILVVNEELLQKSTTLDFNSINIKVNVVHFVDVTMFRYFTEGLSKKFKVGVEDEEEILVIFT